jgi:O-methyltransferase
MTLPLKSHLKRIVNRLGYDVVSSTSGIARHALDDFKSTIDPKHCEILDFCEKYTMTGLQSLYALVQAVEYVVKNQIPGDIVECGVWRGGSMMAIAKTLIALNHQERNLYLYDTFEGMPEPTEQDVSFRGNLAGRQFRQLQTTRDRSNWCYAALDEVRKNLAETGYASRRIHFVKGKVEDTIPRTSPDSISILRLDTDWYESTRHELLHLFPRLSRRGVLIVDDYGHWLGARQAVDEYFASNGVSLLLNRINYTACIAVNA